MDKIALFYSFNTQKTAKIAEKIKSHFKNEEIDLVNAETITEQEFLSYHNLILGVPTWFDGELPNYWDEFVPAMEDLNLKGKKIAIFGLGDQKNYPENFLDAVGIMADLLAEQGAQIVGFFPVADYHFEKSRALKGDQLCGLGIDYENQHQLTDSRVEAWCKQLKKEFEDK